MTSSTSVRGRRAGLGLAVGLAIGILVEFAAERIWPRVALVHATSWLVLGFVVLPIAFTFALGVVAAVLTALTAAPALLWRLRGRPSGWASLCRELWALPAAVVPKFVAAVAAVRKPILWGALLGFVAAVGSTVAANGLQP